MYGLQLDQVHPSGYVPSSSGAVVFMQMELPKLPRFADGQPLLDVDLYALAGFSAALVRSALHAVGVEGFFRPHGHMGATNALHEDGIMELYAVVGGCVVAQSFLSIGGGNGTLWIRLRVASTLSERDASNDTGIRLEAEFSSVPPGKGYVALLRRTGGRIALLLPCLTLDAVDGVQRAFLETVRRSLQARLSALHASVDAEAVFVAIDALERVQPDSPPSRGVEAVSGVLAACCGLLLRKRHAENPSPNVPSSARGRAIELHLEGCHELHDDLSRNLLAAARKSPNAAGDLVHWLTDASALIDNWANVVHSDWEEIAYESAAERAQGEMCFLFCVGNRRVRLDIGVDPSRLQPPDIPVMWRFIGREGVGSDHDASDERRVDRDGPLLFDLGVPPVGLEYLEVRLPRGVAPRVKIKTPDMGDSP